ncbi:ecto-ADP-ribosyltransferase 5-like [Chanos chanos]|uniref:NAD(P)(+)--arginine ADP-ribosyltransferase n=1 Tax=Chanos chanos TaxID=29144 RepID=A0A6J2VPL6_CHACN|nr:ecto-ADP-ribosyltransferase 5-like [Chanos chanos]
MSGRRSRRRRHQPSSVRPDSQPLPVCSWVLPLDMALDSVDDACVYCTEKMSKLVKEFYLVQEMNTNTEFRNAWYEGQNRAKPGDGLNKEQAVATWVYTSNDIYTKFNEAVSNGKGSYENGKFQYTSLYFFLTTAIQCLKKKQQPHMITYRRTANFYHNIPKGTTVRLGRFASSSWDAKANVNFGNKTCFKTHTQFGADISNFSVYKQENEILIPPYEKFRVISVQYRMYNPYLWCEVVYTLQSVGTQSNLNCALIHKGEL